MKILIAGLAKTGTTGLLYLIANSFDKKPRLLFEPKKCPADLHAKGVVVDGHTMRLPGIKELASIVDDTHSSPASFAEFDTAWENTFTANTYWFLNFAFGEVKQTSGDARSRCVSGP